MRQSFALVRAARGPLMLIALGLLFLLDQYASISFSRTWPILFIVYGVLKLIERVLAPAAPPSPQPPAWTPASGGRWTPPAQGGFQS